MKAVVLAGGKGTRLLPYTQIFPKPLVPIGDMPILEILLVQMKAAGVSEVTLAVGHLSELMRAFFQDGSQWGLRIRYSYEREPLGTAGPLAQVKGLDDTFLVTNGDVLTTLPLADLVRSHRASGAAATIAMYNRPVKVDLGVIVLEEDGRGPGGCARVVDYIEKPSYNYQVSMGIYVFEPRVLSFIQPGARLDFPDLVKKLLAAGETVNGYPFDGYWQDLGRPSDYEQAQQDFERMRCAFLGADDRVERL